MDLRRYQDGDAPALLAVFLSSVREIAARDYRPEQIAAWAPADLDPTAWASHLRALRPWVVTVDGDIAGYADLQPQGHIDHFFVAGAWAQRGVGRLLMHHLHGEAQRQGVRELTADVSKTAEPFFARHGFTVVERRFPERRGVVLENARMRKVVGNEPLPGWWSD